MGPVHSVTWSAGRVLILVWIGILLTSMEVTAKAGAKIRKHTNKKNRDPIRGANRQGSGSGGSEESLNYLTSYRFRNASYEEKLLAFLFTDYDPVARAVMDTSKSVQVEIDFVLLRIHGLDERSQILTTTGLIIAEWTDERLTWESEKFGNLTSIIVKADKIWLPELAVMNGAEELMPDFERIRVLLSNTGRLHWEPGGIFRTTCDIDITYFPFDVQDCHILIGAYSYYSHKMNITNLSHEVITHDFRLNGEWHLYGTTASWNMTFLPCCEDSGYSHVVFRLHLSRRSKFYVMNIVLPCIMLSVLIMIGFYLPPDAGEKISLGISVLLAFTVFLLMIADNIPRTSLAIPLMVIYLTATMTLGTISICLTVMVLNIHHRSPGKPVPECLKRIILGCMARIMCVPTSYKREQKLLKHRCYHQNFKIKSQSPISKNGALDMDDYELIRLTVNNSKTHLPLAHSHLPSTAINSSPRTPLPATPPSVHTERRRSFKRKVLRPEPSADPEPPDYSRDWHEVAHVLDRVFFWLLFVCMTASALFSLLYPKYSGVEAEMMKVPKP